jgi:hypothetical protein
VSNPSAPVIIGGVDSPGDAQDVAVAGHHAYVADGIFGLLVSDVSSPTAPVSLGSAPGNAVGVDVARDYVWVAGGPSGFTVLPMQCSN